MPEGNNLKPSSIVPDPPLAQGQGEAPPFSTEKSEFALASPPRQENPNRPREISRILSPQGYPESTFKTLMKILAKG